MIDEKLKKWIVKLFNSSELNLYILHDLKEQDILTEEYDISVSERGAYRSVIKKSIGYLGVKDDVQFDFLGAIFSLAISQIESKNYTIEGLVNFLVLYDRIGVVGEARELKESNYKKICLSINDIEYKKVVESLVKLLNSVIIFGNTNGSEQYTFQGWLDLMHSVDYLEHFDNPVDILRDCIFIRKKDTDLIQLIKLATPHLRVLLFEYGIDLDTINEKDVLEHIQSNNDEASFYAALIIDNVNSIPRFLDDKLFNALVVDRWEGIGRYIFRRVFAGNRQMNDQTKEFFSKHIDDWFVKLFTNEHSENIIGRFEWPNDYLAFGGWLYEYSDERKKEDEDIVFDGKLIQGLVDGFKNVIRDTKKGIPNYIINHSVFYNSWFSNPEDVKAIYIQTYIVWSMMICHDDDWEGIKAEFKKLSYELKVTYYGSYTARRLARDISNHFLSLLFTYPLFKDDKIEGGGRIKEILEIFYSIVGRQWIVYLEREKIIWDSEDSQPNFSDIDIHYLFARIKGLPIAYQDVYSDFINNIKKMKTTEWPIHSS